MKLRSLVAVFSLIASLAAASRFGLLVGLFIFAICALCLAPMRAACFANNFGVLNNTILVFDAFSQFLEALLPIRNMVLDVQDEKTGIRTGRPGDVITVKDWRSTVTAYQPNPTYAATDMDFSAGDRQVTLPNLPWAISVKLTAAEYRLLASGSTGGKEYMTFRDKLALLMINGLGKKLMDLWFAVITTANFPDVSNKTVNAVGAFTRSIEIDLDTKLFGRNVPSDGAQIIANPTLYGEWAKDHIAIQTNTGQDRQKNLLVQGGKQSNNSNFTFWRTNRTMPANAARAFAIGRTGVVAAFRAPDEATFENDPVSLNLMLAPVTEIPMLSRLWKNAADGSIQLDLATLPVFAKGQTEAVERIEAA
jgi:hypothetical protein